MTEGNILLETRLKRNLTLKEVASKVKKDVSTIARYEKGDIYQIGLGTILEFSEALDVSPFFLMGFVDNPYFCITECLEAGGMNQRTEILVESNQLAPIIWQDDLVSIEHIEDVSEVSVGDIVYVSIEDELTLRRVIKTEDEQLFLLPPDSTEAVIPIESTSIQVIGIARTVHYDLKNRTIL